MITVGSGGTVQQVVNGTITTNSPKWSGPRYYTSHNVTLEAGQVLKIELQTSANLRLEGGGLWSWEERGYK